MIEPCFYRFSASDGYAFHVVKWSPPAGRPLGQVVILHGVQSHGGWYHRLGRNLAEAGYEAHFPDRRGSGANERERGHASTARRLVFDISEFLGAIKTLNPGQGIALAGISWGGKLAVLNAGYCSDRVDALALICPGLHPRVGVSINERARIFLSFLANRRKRFPIPLSDPALFTASPEGQAFIAADPLGLHEATAGLLMVSTFIDLRVSRIPRRVKQPVLLMLAGRDRIVDNRKTGAFFERLASSDREVIEYGAAHHTLEFEPDPSRYASDLANWLGRVLRRPCRDAPGFSELGSGDLAAADDPAHSGPPRRSA